MGEVTGAVIATALVLGAVFVPVAFFPGTTGRLYQQFALTIAFSMAISAFNALTLTPALAGAPAGRDGEAEGRVLPRREPRHRRRHRADGRAALRRLIRVARRRRARVRRAARRDLLGLHARADRLRARRGPGLHLHHHPGAAGRVARLHDEHREAGRADPREDAARSSTCSASAASASPARRPNQGILFCMLKDFAERPGRAAFGAGGRRPAVRHVQRDHRRDGHSVPAAVDPRPRQVRRLPVRAARPERRPDRGPGRRRAQTRRRRRTRRRGWPASSRSSRRTIRSSS